MRFLILQKGILYEVLLFLLKWNLLSKLLAIKCTIGVTLGHLQVVQTASLYFQTFSLPQMNSLHREALNSPFLCPWWSAICFPALKVCLDLLCKWNLHSHFHSGSCFQNLCVREIEGPSRGRISIIRFMKPNNVPPFGHTIIYSSSLLLIDMEVVSVFWI